MRKIMFTIFTCVLLSAISVTADAAFVIKSRSVDSVAAVSSADGSNAVISGVPQSYNEPSQQQYDRGYRNGGNIEASRAFFWARWGIIIWPLGILAIIHGVRALSRSRGGRSDDIAALSIVLGALEVLATIGAIVFFFVVFL